MIWLIDGGKETWSSPVAAVTTELDELYQYRCWEPQCFRGPELIECRQGECACCVRDAYTPNDSACIRPVQWSYLSYAYYNPWLYTESYSLKSDPNQSPFKPSKKHCLSFVPCLLTQSLFDFFPSKKYRVSCHEIILVSVFSVHSVGIFGFIRV